MSHFKAIIVDDEPPARRILRTMLSEHSAVIGLKGEAATGAEAVRLIQELKPDVIFLDIQMPDLTGFEVLEQINYQPYIIFTTAYEHYAVKAFESFSIDYLLKPIREERLEQSIRKLERLGHSGNVSELSKLRLIMEEMRTQKKAVAFPIRQGDKISLINFENISHFEADDKYVALFTIDGKKFLTDQTLTNLTEKLPSSFLRVQKSYIVNREKIKEIHKHFNGRFILTMNDKNQTRITTGLTFYESIKEELGI